MVIHEVDVPGVGKQYEVPAGGETRFVVIVHHDGRREVYRREGPDADAEKLFDLDAAAAREAASVLQAADFQPLDLDDVDVPLGDAIMEWVEVPADSPVAGETLSDAGIRAETGATVAAVQRGAETLANPGADTVLEPGDILVAIGSRDEQKALQSLVAAGEGGSDDGSETA
ncbi:TrkA domain protein [Halarchaeum rubridurum]|nr:cation:proton antiporter regulatory subunit [Halarchaeum rubridurum]MBP1954047.1 TrkA domain protein [Halarchaeum rubridurum]